MYCSPASALGSWLRGVWGVGVLVGAVWLLAGWYLGLPLREHVADPLAEMPGTRRLLSPWERIASSHPGWDARTAAPLVGVGLLLWSFQGRRFSLPRRRLSKGGGPPPLAPYETRRIVRPDGSELHVEVSGPADGPTVVLTHGWTLNRREWVYLQAAWQGRFRIVVWDLAGLGKSRPPTNRDYSLDKMADDLRAVVEECTTGPVALISHSIGGMILLTLARRHPDLIGGRVARLVLAQTTYTNPLETIRFRWFFRPLQKPVIEPLLWLHIYAWPVFWALTWLSYRNGLLHSATLQRGFTHRVTRAKLDYITGFFPRVRPDVMARGVLAMLHCDERETLRTIEIPVLVYGAAHDPLTLYSASCEMHAALPHGKLKTLAPAKHFGLIEHDDEFAKVVGKFCAKLAHHQPQVADAAPQHAVSAD